MAALRVEGLAVWLDILMAVLLVAWKVHLKAASSVSAKGQK